MNWPGLDAFRSGSAWRSLGPAIPRPAPADTARSALGVAMGLAVAELVLRFVSPGTPAALLLIAPFGATGYLIFAVPSSPLAQPWPVVVGNTVSALAALLVLLLPLPGLAQAALAVALAVAGMALLRAQHPPGGAVALACVLAALAGHPPAWVWPLLPVALGSLTLAGFGALWAALTGRAYPFRLPAPVPGPMPGPVSGSMSTPVPTAPVHRMSPSPEALAESLTQLRLAANIGIEDLARVIDRAEALSPGLDPAALHAGAVMSREVVTAGADAPAADLIALFQRLGFKSLPVLDGQGQFLGLIAQVALLGAGPGLTAAALARPVQTLTPEAPLADLIAMLSDGVQAAVPILDQGRLVGIVTRSDLIAALLHQLGLR